MQMYRVVPQRKEWIIIQESIPLCTHVTPILQSVVHLLKSVRSMISCYRKINKNKNCINTRSSSKQFK